MMEPDSPHGYICPPAHLSRTYDLSKCRICGNDFSEHGYVKPTCPMSDSTKPHTLEKRYGCISSCYTCRHPLFERVSSYYHCDTCNLQFHEFCCLYPLEIKHPFHSAHSLKFSFSSGLSYSDIKQFLDPHDSSGQNKPNNTTDDASISDVKCKCCQKHLGEVYYHCSICKFSLNLACTRNSPPVTILNLKSHEHTLTVSPRRIPLPCDACGLSLGDICDHVYTCNPCNYMVHRTCIDLPRVIKITRHPHRLSLSTSLPSGLFRCGVCRHPVNVTYGQFSCVKGCHYAVHSKCAVEERVWDGIDLDGVPEDPDELKDIDSFERIDDRTIKHFSHDHYLRLDTNNTICDGNKFCQACILPILISESFYSCMQCDDFLFHEACAYLPRKKDHPLHKHSLILHPIPPQPMFLGKPPEVPEGMFIEGMFRCNGCDQIGCGFMYKCIKDECESKFQLDTRCASLPDPIIHGSHPHDLFFNLTQGECMGCNSHCSPFSLECMECKSFLGLKCISLPSVTHYKHDSHPLTLCYGEEDTTNGHYWCEICEANLDANKWFYQCNDYCNVTLHIGCLLGKQIFMKPMPSNINSWPMSIICNTGNTRPICRMSDPHHRCTEPFFFKMSDVFTEICSLSCFLRCFDE